MAGYWINSKGKKFIGDAGIVPAPDDKNPNVVSYDEWNSLTLQLTTSGGVSESNNNMLQILSLEAEMQASGNSINEWGYDIIFSSVDGIINDIVQTTLGATAQLEVPIGVVEGDVIVVTCMSGGHSQALSIVVTA